MATVARSFTAVIAALLLVMSGVTVAETVTTTDDFEDGTLDGWDHPTASISSISTDGDHSLSVDSGGDNVWTNGPDIDTTTGQYDVRGTTMGNGSQFSASSVEVYDGGTNSYIRLRMDTADGQWTLGAQENGNLLYIDHFGSSSSGDWYEYRIRITPDELKVKTWVDGSGEPASWQYTNTNVPSFTGQIALRETYDATYHDDVSVTRESYAIEGKVTDQDNDPVKDATVTLNTSETDTTNSIGEYSIADLENGTYRVTVEKSGYENKTKYATIDGSSETVNFQIRQFNKSIILRTKDYLQHGQESDYTVIIENESGRYNVTADTSVTSGNTDVVTVDQTAQVIQATSNISINQRTTVTAEYQGTNGSLYTTTRNVTVANATVDNMKILPTSGRTQASFEDQTFQAILVAAMAGAAVALLAGGFAGLSAQAIVMTIGWFGGYVGNGMLIVSFMFAIFVGANIATNMDMVAGVRK